MGVPKKRHTKKYRGDRRAKTGVVAVSVTRCLKCGRPLLPHRLCGACGHYGKVKKTETAVAAKELAA